MFPFFVFLMSLKDLGNPIINSFDQVVNIEASISGLPSESYFRAEWQKSSGDIYFGYTKVGEVWMEVQPGQDCKNYLHVSDVDTSSLSLLTKVGDNNSLTNGSHNLKLRRYTSSCASYSDSDPISVILNLPLPTSTPTISPAPTHSPLPTKTLASTGTPVPTKLIISTPLATSKINPEPTQNPDKTPEIKVLGLENTAIPVPTGLDATKSGDAKNNNIITAIILVGLGAVFISTSIYMTYKTSKLSKD